MKKYLPLAVLGLLVACSKQKPEPYIPKTYPIYQNNFLTRFSANRLFTRTAEITNSTTVQKYSAEFSNYLYSTTSAFTDPGYQKFALVSEDSLWNLGTIPVGEAKRVAVDAYDRFAGNSILPVNDTNYLVLHLMKYKLHSTVTTPSGYTYLQVRTPAFIMKKVSDTLFFPINRVVVVSRTGSITRFSTDQFNNVLDPSGMQKLGENDTLLVQSFEVGLVKQK